MTPTEENLKFRSISIYWPEGVGFLISQEGQWKFKSHSYWPEGVTGLTPRKKKRKLRSYVMHLPEGMAGFDSEEREVEVKILLDILARGGGMLDPS